MMFHEKSDIWKVLKEEMSEGKDNLDFGTFDAAIKLLLQDGALVGT